MLPAGSRCAHVRTPGRLQSWRQVMKSTKFPSPCPSQHATRAAQRYVCVPGSPEATGIIGAHPPMPQQIFQHGDADGLAIVDRIDARAAEVLAHPQHLHPRSRRCGENDHRMRDAYGRTCLAAIRCRGVASGAAPRSTAAHAAPSLSQCMYHDRLCSQSLQSHPSRHSLP